MVKIVVLLVVVIGIVAIAQLAKVTRIAARISNRKEEEISLRDNKLNAFLMLAFMIVFFGSFVYMASTYGVHALGEAASDFGAGKMVNDAGEVVDGDVIGYDALFNLNLFIIVSVFFITNALLFIFAFKYYYKPGTRAFWYPHNNKLEIIWTVVPALVLFVIIVLGLMKWQNITGPASENAEVVEIYSYQFGWKARYGGQDNKLGASDYLLVGGANPLGVVSSENVATRLKAVEGRIGEIEADLADENKVFAVAEEDELVSDLDRYKTIKRRLDRMSVMVTDSLNAIAADDFITGELHLRKGQEYEFKFRSQDVIHSAFMPHFRAQYNTVPGMQTRIKFTPIMTTEEKRAEMGDDTFDFVLLCNKVCGASHSNMQMKIVVHDDASYKAWYNDQVSKLEKSKK